MKLTEVSDVGGKSAEGKMMREDLNNNGLMCKIAGRRKSDVRDRSWVLGCF